MYVCVYICTHIYILYLCVRIQKIFIGFGKNIVCNM